MCAGELGARLALQGPLTVAREITAHLYGGREQALAARIAHLNSLVNVDSAIILFNAPTDAYVWDTVQQKYARASRVEEQSMCRAARGAVRALRTLRAFTLAK